MGIVVNNVWINLIEEFIFSIGFVAEITVKLNEAGRLIIVTCAFNYLEKFLGNVG